MQLCTRVKLLSCVSSQWHARSGSIQRVDFLKFCEHMVFVVFGTPCSNVGTIIQLWKWNRHYQFLLILPCLHGDGFFSSLYEGRSINKLQNGIILLIFKIWKVRNIDFVRNLIGHIYTEIFVKMTPFLWVMCTYNTVSHFSILPILSLLT